MYFDSKFNFNAHIEHTVAKLITLVHMLGRTAKLQWGLGHKALKTIYEGAVVPILTYGAPIWIEAIRKNRNLTKYKRIQRLMNIKIARAYRTISYDASCMIAGVRPIQITIEQTVQTHMALKINNLEYDTPLEVRHWRHPAELATIQEVENGSTYTTEVYTDGSKIGDNVGAAGIIFVNGTMVHQLKFKLHGHCTNNQAEQTAILKVLEKLEELQNGQDIDKRVAIYTDSKITLDLLQNKFKRNRLIELIRDKIIALTHLKWILHFGWVKVHAGIAGKEMVDKLAKEAAVEEGPVIYDKISREVLVTRVKENGLKMWQQQWTNTGKGAVTKAFFPSVSDRLRKKNPYFSRIHNDGDRPWEVKIVSIQIWHCG
jgi:ribonuclease HI